MEENPVFAPPDVSHLPLAVLHADAHLAVVVKPPGLLSCEGTTTAGFDSVVRRVRAAFPKASGPILAHRLDSPTSGLLVVALDPETHRRLSADFAARRVSRTYRAVVTVAADREGPPLHAGEAGVIALPLRADWALRPRQVVDHAHGKPSETHFRILSAGRHSASLVLTPRTGRTHQLRVHLSHPEGLRAPILGDRLYGCSAEATRLHLHAETLSFAHPMTGEALAFRSDPEDF